MKRLGTMLLAGLLLLGLAQCKKEQTVEPDTDEFVYITVDVNGGASTGSATDGSRVVVNPNAPGGYATVAFEEGDRLYVGNNGVYRGYLLYQGGKFCGNLGSRAISFEGDYLHFYFVGGCTPEAEGGFPTSQAVQSGRTTLFTVNISDQTSRYPVIAYGHSTKMYSTKTASYSATLDNYCSIIKIPIEGAGTANTVTLRGMKNVVTVHLGANKGDDVTGDPFTFSLPETGCGEIKLHAESNTEKWAVVLPQGAVVAQLCCEGFKNAPVSVPEITADRYYDDDISGVTLTEGTTINYFSVAANTQVCFAPGNLQAVFAEAGNQSCTWQFADRQFDYVGDAVANTAVGISQNATQNIVSTPGTVDLFGWVGASSQDALAYGICNIWNSMRYGEDVEPLKSDWGVPANAASLGGYNTWYTPSLDELDYLVNTRATSATINGIENARYTTATINTDRTPVNGIILFPDNYAGPTSNTADITFGNINGRSNWGTQGTAFGWASLEAAGCVFLPAAGFRHIPVPDHYVAGILYTYCGDSEVLSAGTFGLYWSSTSGTQTYAKCLQFNGGGFYPTNWDIRASGGSVRLVRPAE